MNIGYVAKLSLKNRGCYEMTTGIRRIEICVRLLRMTCD